MTGNGNHTTYKHGEIGDGVWHCFNYFIMLLEISQLLCPVFSAVSKQVDRWMCELRPGEM